MMARRRDHPRFVWGRAEIAEQPPVKASASSCGCMGLGLDVPSGSPELALDALSMCASMGPASGVGGGSSVHINDPAAESMNARSPASEVKSVSLPTVQIAPIK